MERSNQLMICHIPFKNTTVIPIMGIYLPWKHKQQL